MEFAGKAVIVTGGGSGIGELCARRFAEEGASVVVADRNETEARRVADAIRQAAGEACGERDADRAGGPADGASGCRGAGESVGARGPILAIRADVSMAGDVERLIRETIEAFGRIDVLFNNAAVILPKALEEIGEEEFDRVVAVNLKGPFLTTKRAIPHLRRTKGTVVNMASLNGLVGQKHNPVYAATKGGVIALTKSLALDYAPDGVRINCVCPAGVLTPLLADWAEKQPDPAAASRELAAMHPLGRPARTEEVAEAVLYLAGRRSAFITGTALTVDGGASLGY